MRPLSEDLLHYLWKTKKLDFDNLKTVNGEALKIISFGHHNESDGPDFLQAQVEINGIKWNGSIEIHIKSSDWKAHNHQTDKNYENTILHVVYENDTPILRQDDKTIIPCLEIKNRIPQNLLKLYSQFDSLKWIPCEELIGSASDISKFLAKERALSSRMEGKWNAVKVTNTDTENNWEETVYRLIGRSFGLVHNADAFLEITSQIPFSIVKKNADNVDNLEAIFYGVAGLLNQNFKDKYPQKLKENYAFLKSKYHLKESSISLNHKAVRPHNFPEIAISQFIALIRQPMIISKIMEASHKELLQTIKVSASQYWDDHFTFDKVSSKKEKTLGKSKINTIIINAIVPMFLLSIQKTG